MFLCTNGGSMTDLAWLLLEREAGGSKAIAHDGEEENEHLYSCDPPREVRPIFIHLVQLFSHLQP